MKPLIFLGLFGALSLYAATVVSSPMDITTVIMQPQGDKELSWVDEQIQAILPARVGAPDRVLNALRDPMKLKKALPTTLPTATVPSSFRLLSPPKLGATASPTLPVVSVPKIVEVPLRLQAFINKSVLINGKWYKLGDEVRGMSVAEIRSNSVLLTGPKDQKLILFLNKQNNNIKIITK